MLNLRMFEVKFLGPTNFKGSRIKITDLRMRKSVTLSKSYHFNNSTDQAIDYLSKRGINLVGETWCDKTKKHYLLTDNFNISIKD